MAKKKEVGVTEEVTVEPKYLKSQIRTLRQYRYDIDLIDLFFEDDIFYTLSEVDKVLKEIKGDDN